MTIDKQMEYASKHFFFIADQRIKTFHVYAILLVASTGASLITFEKMSLLGLIITGIYHIVISISFYLIDHRNRRLLGITRDCMVKVESFDDWPTHVKPSTIEKATFEQLGFSKHATYTFAFKIATGSQFILGLFSLFISLIILIYHAAQFDPSAWLKSIIS